MVFWSLIFSRLIITLKPDRYFPRNFQCCSAIFQYWYYNPILVCLLPNCEKISNRLSTRRQTWNRALKLKTYAATCGANLNFEVWFLVKRCELNLPLISRGLLINSQPWNNSFVHVGHRSSIILAIHEEQNWNLSRRRQNVAAFWEKIELNLQIPRAKLPIIITQNCPGKNALWMKSLLHLIFL